MMNVESISSLTALLYEVRQLSRRAAQVNQRASLKRFSVASQENQAGPVQPGQIHGRPYGTGVYIRNLSVPSPHSATTLGGDHTFRHIEKKYYQRDQRKNRLL